MRSEIEGPVVTIDGPAGSGKSSTAREVARRLTFRHLDSGALYRGLTYALIEAGVLEAEWANLAVKELHALGLTLESTKTGFEVRLTGQLLVDELRSVEVTDRVSLLARVPAVRECLIGLQREAGSGGGLIVDGRDMGTVVFPEAELKVYLDADLRERARRRLLESDREVLHDVDLAEEALALEERDDLDSRRAISPLKCPPGAVRIDTTHLSFEEQVSVIVELVNELTVRKRSSSFSGLD